MLKVLYGLPNAGKSLYVSTHMKSNDLYLSGDTLRQGFNLGNYNFDILKEPIVIKGLMNILNIAKDFEHDVYLEEPLLVMTPQERYCIYKVWGDYFHYIHIVNENFKCITRKGYSKEHWENVCKQFNDKYIDVKSDEFYISKFERFVYY